MSYISEDSEIINGDLVIRRLSVVIRLADYKFRDAGKISLLGWSQEIPIRIIVKDGSL